MPANGPPLPWRPPGLRRWQHIWGRLHRWPTGEPIDDCWADAYLSWERVPVGPEAKHPRDQVTRMVAVLRVTVHRGKRPVAVAELPIEELATGIDPETWRRPVSAPANGWEPPGGWGTPDNNP